MKRPLPLAFLSALVLTASAQVKTQVTEFSITGPFAVTAPFATDTVDVLGRPPGDPSLLPPIAPQPANVTSKTSGIRLLPSDALPALSGSRAVAALTFYVNNTSYVKGNIAVQGPKSCKLYIDGEEAPLLSPLSLTPEHHTFTLSYLSEPDAHDSLSVTLDAPFALQPTASPRHPYMVHDMLDGRSVRQATLSADGQYVCVSYQSTARDGSSTWDYELRDVKSCRLLRKLSSSVRWMPLTVAWLDDVKEDGIRKLYKVEPLTGERTLWAAGLPDGDFDVSPTEDYIVVSVKDDGPEEDSGVFEVVEMDDRQPGWRQRSYLVRHDVANGVNHRLTFGARGQHLNDISADGRKLLVFTSYTRLGKRPTEVVDYYLIDTETLHADTLLRCQGFIGTARLSPDGRQVLFEGSPEAFERIGCQLPPDVTPSMTETELFLFDVDTHKVTPLTRDFDPSVQSCRWSAADGQIYFNAEDRDYVRMFVLNPKTGSISQLPLEGDNIYRFDMATHATVLAHLSNKVMEPTSAYVTTLKAPSSKIKVQSSKLYDGSTTLADAELGTCQDWNFVNTNGDTVYGRLYLPRDLNPLSTVQTAKLPLIVYYYGGCSPSTRSFGTRYPAEYWTSLGYVVYVIQPSGCTGFGQEWASRHVNTAGGAPRADGTVPAGTPAGDIIEGTRRLCQEHPFIDERKIGCIGASYGGFMTMYLQTVTDIFAAAVSHAGIANHTSYWGEGYWGYNYSEVSMANSYPWSHRQLYVDQSPLFNADKIHTPLLLLHGNADTNVPIIESLQMFTALKLLGREVALVEVQGENHHVLDYKKRTRWMATQMAWFQRWLKDDPTWWDALYPKKHL